MGAVMPRASGRRFARRVGRAIAATHGLDPARVLCGAGSMEPLGLRTQHDAGFGVEVVGSQLGYECFQVQCALTGATVRVVAEPAMRADVAGIAAAVGERTRPVFVVDPNDPAGAACRASPGRARPGGYCQPWNTLNSTR